MHFIRNMLFDIWDMKFPALMNIFVMNKIVCETYYRKYITLKSSTSIYLWPLVFTDIKQILDKMTLDLGNG